MVEDTHLIRQFLVSALKAEGYTNICDTASANEALQLIKEWCSPLTHSSSTPILLNNQHAEDMAGWGGPDIIFLDINLDDHPERGHNGKIKCGLELLAKIRNQSGGGIPFIVMESSNDPHQASPVAFDLGANAYMPKPFTPNDVSAMMAEYRKYIANLKSK